MWDFYSVWMCEIIQYGCKRLFSIDVRDYSVWICKIIQYRCEREYYQYWQSHGQGRRRGSPDCRRWKGAATIIILLQWRMVSNENYSIMSHSLCEIHWINIFWKDTCTFSAKSNGPVIIVNSFTSLLFWPSPLLKHYVHLWSICTVQLPRIGSFRISTMLRFFTCLAIQI